MLGAVSVDDLHVGDLGLRDAVDRGGDEGAELLEHVHLARGVASGSPLGGDHAERFGDGLAVLDLRRRVAARLELLRFALRFGGEHDVALEAELLELGTQGLELLLGHRALGLGGDRRFVLDLLRLRFELRELSAVAVLLLEQHRLGPLLRRLRRLPRRGLRLCDRLIRGVFGVRRVTKHRRDAPAAEVREILLLVGDVLHLEHVELEPELVEIVARVLDQRLGELQSILVHFFGRELRDDLAQHAFERLLRRRRNLLRTRAEEALDRVAHADVAARDLDVGDRVHAERDAALRVRVVHRDLDREEPHIHAVDGLEERHAEAAPAVEDLVAARRPVGETWVRPLKTRISFGRQMKRKFPERYHDDEEEKDEADRPEEHREHGAHVGCVRRIPNPRVRRRPAKPNSGVHMAARLSKGLARRRQCFGAGNALGLPMSYASSSGRFETRATLPSTSSTMTISPFASSSSLGGRHHVDAVALNLNAHLADLALRDGDEDARHVTDGVAGGRRRRGRAARDGAEREHREEP